MSSYETPVFPTPLTLYGRTTWAEEKRRRLEWHLNYSAVAFTSGLADGKSPESMRYELEYFKARRAELAQAELLRAEAGREFDADTDSRREDRKKMPPAVAPAEGRENPTNQEGIFNDHHNKNAGPDLRSGAGPSAGGE